MQRSAEQTPLNRPAWFWWVRLPGWATHVSRTLAAALADGSYLVAWPRVAAAAPPLVFVVGLALGVLRPIGQDTYTYSLFNMGVMVGVSSLGAALGAWIWLGYCIADFALYMHLWAVSGGPRALVLVRIPMLLSYALLASALVGVPLLSRGLHGLSLPGARSRRVWRVAAEATAHALLSGALVLAWTQSMILLIRPVFVWQGLDPISAAAIEPLQRRGWVLALLAVVFGALRIVLDDRAARHGARRRYLAHLRSALAPRGAASRRRLPLFATTLLKAGATTLLLAGMLQSWVDALLLFGLQLGVALVRDGLLPRVPFWTRPIGRVPLLLRLMIGVAASYGLGLLIVGRLWVSSGPLRPIIFAIAPSLLVFALLLPGQPATRSPGASDGGQA